MRALVLAGDVTSAAGAALAAHGAELFGFLIGVLDDVSAARTLYVELRDRVAGELGAFRWQCPLRTWLYAQSRRALREHRLGRAEDLDLSSDSSQLASVSRRRTRAARAMTKLRRSLTEEERELLILRVDRRLDWDDLALTSLGERAASGALAAESRLERQRMDAIVARLEVVAVEQRILRPRGRP